MTASVIVSSDYTNTGTLTGDANDFALGILAPTTASITNSGTITQPGAGNNAVDISAALTGTLTNSASGVISGTDTTNTQGNDDTVIVFGGITGGIVNSGIISSAGGGVGAAAVDIGSGATNISNQAGGTLKTSGTAGAAALLFDQANSSTIVNAGQILATGSGGNGIYLGGALTGSITNSGTISETGGGTTATSTVPGVGTVFYLDTAILVNGGISGGIQNSGTITGSGVNATIDIVAGKADITNAAAGTIAHQGSGFAIDYSGATAASTLTNAGTITGSIELSGKGDTVILQGGSITGDILASAAGSGTVEIAVGAGHTYTAAGKIGDPAGKSLADIAVQSGILSVGAGAIATATVTLSAGAEIDLTGTAASGASIDSSNHFVLKSATGATVASFQLAGASTGLTFTATSDGQGGTLIETAYGAALAVSSAGSLTSAVPVVDSATDVSAQLDGLESLASAGKLASIALNDSGIPTLSLSAAQTTADAAALAKISGYFSTSISATGANLTIQGVSQALGNTVVFSGTAGSYTLTPSGDGTSFTVASTGSTDHLSDIQALKFSDFTLIVAQAPGSSAVTTGNITDLYAAVLGREPDVAGLNYYQKLLAAAPSTPITVFALDFLNSSEYTSSHSYAQTAAGDAQFITDTYSNLLHRAPETGAVAWYQANVINPLLANLTPGTAAYTTAELNAHAALLTDFSASAEFVGDVQVTAAHPASAQHWLVLI